MKPDLKQARDKAAEKLLNRDAPGNIVAVGIGKKLVKGRPTPTDCVRVYVVSKLKPAHVRPAALVLPDFNRAPTDVVEIGPLGRKGREPWIKPLVPARIKPAEVIGTKPFPPPAPGSRIRVETIAGNVNSGAIGTLGAVVQDGAGQRYILSCNHVLAVDGRVVKGDAEILSAVFVGDEPSIADPAPFVRLKRSGANFVDCALAQIKKAQNVSAEFHRRMGPLNPDPIEPEVQMKVQKLGAATDYTTGTIVDISTNLYVDTSFGRFRFNDQIVIDAGKDLEFAAEGDSGSIVWDQKSRQPVAMIFAASGQYAIACPLSRVLEDLKSQLANGKKAGPALNLLVHDT